MDWLKDFIPTIVISAITGGLFVQLLRLGPDRKKIGAEAQSQAATATDTLTGAALRMVQQASDDAAEAKKAAKEAEARASAAEKRADAAERAADACAYEVERHREWLEVHDWPPLPAI